MDLPFLSDDGWKRAAENLDLNEITEERLDDATRNISQATRVLSSDAPQNFVAKSTEERLETIQEKIEADEWQIVRTDRSASTAGGGVDVEGGTGWDSLDDEDDAGWDSLDDEDDAGWDSLDDEDDAGLDSLDDESNDTGTERGAGDGWSDESLPNSNTGDNRVGSKDKGDAILEAARQAKESLGSVPDDVQTLIQELERTASGTGRSDVEGAFKNVFRQLQTFETLESALDSYESGGAEAAKGTLQMRSSSQPGPVATLADAFAEIQARDALDAAAREVLDAASNAGRLDGTELQNQQSLETRLERLAETIRGMPTRTVADVVDEMDPATTNELLEALRSENPSRIRSELRNTIDRLEAYDDVQDAMGNVDTTTVMDLSDAVTKQLDDSDGDAVERQLEERASDLQSETWDNPSDVTVYAAERELRFYESKLVPVLDERRPNGNDTPGLADVKRKLAEVEQHRNNTKFNHEIPKLFVNRVDSLVSQAEQAHAAGDYGRADGIAMASSRILDDIDELYTNRDYRNMLKQLR
jgi:hypothetical protein